MKKRIADLHKMAPHRPDGYVKDVLSHASSVDGDFYEISEESFEALKTKYRTIQPIQRDQWPIWVNAIALWHDDSDAGVGDTVHRCLGKFGEAFKLILKKIGIDCGCDARRDEWNQLYRY